MRHSIAWISLAAALVASRAFAQAATYEDETFGGGSVGSSPAPSAPAAEEQDAWAGYLDFAYVYSSAEPDALAARLREYGKETHMSLDDYVERRLVAVEEDGDDGDEVVARRLAIARLLQYLATGEPDSLEASVKAVRSLEGRLGRHENRYWYYYILAHRALEKGHRFDFVGDVLSLWLGVVVPLEAPYETLDTLSLTEGANSGFAAALPYIYENVARLVLIRSQQMGLDRDVDPLGAIVRLLADGRVGGHPEVIPVAASSKEYLARIIERLNGPESDAGSLTFTLALFEASKLHDQARGLLAGEGLSPKAIEAIRLASGAYQTALDRADTVQGECAVYRRVLRQLGEVYAAKQRLGVDPELEIPFTIEGAIEVYAKLALADEDGWKELGYATNGREAYVASMRGLWEEIQETILNAASYYLARSQEAPHLADENAQHAARLYERYLSFFERFATKDQRGGVPDSAYFAAHEAAKGQGDAYLVFSLHPLPEQVELATRRYRSALTIFPFDRRLWPSLTSALERQGREPEYMELVRPVAAWVARSRSVDHWIAKAEPGAESIATMRRALSDSLVIMYLGFGDEAGIDGLEQSVRELKSEREELVSQRAELKRERGGEPGAPRGVEVAGPAAPAPASDEPAPGPLAYSELTRRIALLDGQIGKLDKQIEARSRALPLFKATLATADLTGELRANRSHPLHALLRRMYHEKRAAAAPQQEEKS